MLLKIINQHDLDERKLMDVYLEGNIKNADYFYPEISDRVEALRKTEETFCIYLKTKFFNGKNIYYILELDGVWVSALRLYKINNGHYYLEALETAPDYRRKGYATDLLNAVIGDLKKHGKVKIYDCVRKKNTISLRVHEKCGFKIVSEDGYNYLQKYYDNYVFGLEYES